MKAKDLYFIIILTSVFLLSAAFAIKKVTGLSPLVTETRQLANYEKINIKVAAKILYYQAQEYKVILEAQQSTLDAIITKSENNELTIGLDKNHKFGFKEEQQITISIYSPMITSLKIAGSAGFSNKTPLSSDKLDISVSGSGNVVINSLIANKINAKISGSGNIALIGSCDEQDLHIMGSGKIQNLELACNSSKVKISGSGTVNVMSIDYLHAKIIGSGDVYYKGDPITECSIVGSGKLHSI